jgi:hypothetical protein
MGPQYPESILEHTPPSKKQKRPQEDVSSHGQISVVVEHTYP